MSETHATYDRGWGQNTFKYSVNCPSYLEDFNQNWNVSVNIPPNVSAVVKCTKN
jgi:hypothetical protein